MATVSFDKAASETICAAMLGLNVAYLTGTYLLTPIVPEGSIITLRLTMLGICTVVGFACWIAMQVISMGPKAILSPVLVGAIPLGILHSLIESGHLPKDFAGVAHMCSWGAGWVGSVVAILLIGRAAGRHTLR